MKKFLIEKLLAYARAHLGLAETDEVYMRNVLLTVFHADAPYVGAADVADAVKADVPDALAEEIKAYALAKGLCAEGRGEYFAADIFGLLMPRPSEVNFAFRERLKKEGAQAACDYLYGLSVKSGYVQKTDLSSKLSVKVTRGGKTFEEGTDYTVSIAKQDVTGKWVETDEIVDAGDYRVTVKGVTFDEVGQYFIEIGKRELKTISPSNAFATEDTYFGDPVVQGTKYYYAHTGEEIAPEFTFTGEDGETYTVPADQFEVTYKKNVNGAFQSAKLKDEGIYVIDLITLDADNFTGTVTAASTSDRIEVTTASSFVDVPNDAWYAEAVATAKQQNYIVGLNGSNFFAPMNSMTRADVVCVLYRMAGGTVANEGLSQEESSYVSGFSDVDQHAYYAKAVAWATRAGIVRGYGDTFGTERDVSTEEFATMLARYAAKMGDDTSVDTDSVLAGVADGDKVSSYARDAVAWAVENGYVASNGNLIDPQGSVYRARVVTIAVRYQPEQLHVIL